ncbi:MarR family winged helix-turn-helix transcriptional regulator [Agromyces aureus]|uniref:HTH marR-type domain-containing protein n=1 Tax=Agromyces aureus TaxID=453304 RepID=A0A191WIH5_9MICO|nr:MarR family winged helix-turn-helix transcriptional regulator [Agromyces aureus]ANJ28061.1 hypothetical protein ATC03_16445 [Agromyces aureus]
MTGTTTSRETATSDILGALIVVSRRGVADARTANLSLSMTDQSILGFIVDHPGCRSVDIAQAYRLNRSTVSRQLAGLVALGVVREVADAAGRGTPLELTASGRAAYDEAIAILHGIVAGQLDGWSDDEVARFARDLQRFNVGRPGETRPRHPLETPDGPHENAPQGAEEEKKEQQ